MAENKNSFLLYTDLIHTLEKMPDEKAGLLFKHILRYVNDKDPVSDDLLIELTFEPIKQQFKRDLKKYESVCNRNKANGLKGGRPKEENPNNPVGLLGTQTNPAEPKKPDSDNDTDTDIKKEDSFLWTSVVKSFYDDFRWKEKFCRDKVIKQPLLEIRMKEFISDLELKEDFKDLKELKHHFTNWFNKVKVLPIKNHSLTQSESKQLTDEYLNSVYGT